MAGLANAVPAPWAAPARRGVAVTSLSIDETVPGRPDETSAESQLAYLTVATDAALAGKIAALVTAPISKD